jgi:hypothetical protein
MNEAVEAEYKIHRFVAEHIQTSAVIGEKRKVCVTRKTLTARVDALPSKIYPYQPGAMVFQKVCPASISASDLQDSIGRKKLVYSR